MRSAVLALTLLSIPLFGCRAKKLEAELNSVRDQLSKTEDELATSNDDNKKLKNKNENFKKKITMLEGELALLSGQLDELAKKQGITAAELSDLRKEKAKRERELRVYKDLFSQLKALVDAGTIRVAFRNGRMVLALSNAILFDSGKARLRNEGKGAVAQLVPALRTAGQRDFLVAGHTDNVPIRTARYKSNWELSTARAVVMVNAMIEQGYPAEQLGAAGFGEFDPVGDNTTPDGKAQNRRIEIILMPNLGKVPGMQEMLQGQGKPKNGR